eukprot:5022960-Karenia_brevis.AAC.1
MHYAVQMWLVVDFAIVHTWGVPFAATPWEPAQPSPYTKSWTRPSSVSDDDETHPRNLTHA